MCFGTRRRCGTLASPRLDGSNSHNHQFRDVGIVPGTPTTHDPRYGASKVTVAFLANRGTLCLPAVSGYSGFNGVSFEGNPADYYVGLQHEVGLRLGMVVQSDRILNRDMAPVSREADEKPGQPIIGAGMERTDGHHVNDLPFEQLHPVVRVQHSIFRHPIVVADGEPMRGQHGHTGHDAVFAACASRRVPATRSRVSAMSWAANGISIRSVFRIKS